MSFLRCRIWSLRLKCKKIFERSLAFSMEINKYSRLIYSDMTRHNQDTGFQNNSTSNRQSRTQKPFIFEVCEDAIFGISIYPYIFFMYLMQLYV
jgi:hypothetical protein